MMSRRSLLQSAAGVAAVAVTGSTAAASEPLVPTTDAEIRAAFEGVPRIDDPSPRDRRVAEATLPDLVVPESGPVPDYEAGKRTVEVETPPWVLACAYDRLQDASSPDRPTVTDHFLELLWLHEEYATEGGQDAGEVVVNALTE